MPIRQQSPRNATRVRESTSTTARSASCRSSITVATAAWPSASSTTTRPTTTSARSWGISRPNWTRGNSGCGASPRMVHRCTPGRWRSCGPTSATRCASSTSSKRLPRRYCTRWRNSARNCRRRSQAAPRPPRQGSEGPGQQDPPSEATGSGPVREPAPVRAAWADGRTGEAVARADAGSASVTPPAADHGRSVPVVRPALQNAHGVGAVGETPPACEPTGAVGSDAGQVEEPDAGEGVGVPGRPVVAVDLERGGAGQPEVPEGSEGDLQRADEAASGGATGVGPPTRTPGTATRTDHQDPASGCAGPG